MHQLFRPHYDYFHGGLKNHHNPLASLILVSKFHSSPKTQSPNLKLDFVSHEADSSRASQFTNSERRNDSRLAQGDQVNFQVTHPWPEWVDLMELLFKRGYFEHNGNPFLNGELGTKETNWIRTACLNFARDQSPLIRLFSRKDIHMIAVSGCPSIDRKVVNSGKRLRAHVGIDEGNVCSTCNLRGDCERAYVKAREEEGGRTVDVMRFLLTYGLDSISGKSGNRLSQNRMVKESVRRLLKEMVDFSSQQCDSGEETDSPLSQNHLNVPMKQGDWLCPKCNFLNFAKNIRCKRCDSLSEEKLIQLREDQNHLPLKKGDWICETCNFLNFAKNTRCLQCKEKPPKRHINPGEWECESCNYINFRRNMVCLKCDHRRPKAFTAMNNNDIPIGQDGTNNRSDAKRWRFLEEENGGNQMNSRDKKPGFIDFPIVGGKSSLSRDEEEREKWKLEMLKMSKTGTIARRGDEELRNMEVTRQSNYVETSDEDMAEWFGCSKKMG